MNKRCLLTILMGGCAAMGAFAQQHATGKKTEMSVDLNPVVVTGTGTHQRLKNTPAPVEVVTANEIKKAGITDFQQAMTMLVPSLSFSTNSMGSYLMMNGLSNKYVLILINGRKLTGDTSNNIDLSRSDMSRVKRIEVLDGAGSSLYGSDAIAGVINIITNEPKELMQVTSTTRYEDHRQLTQMVNADIATEKFGSYTSYKHEQSAGWQNSDLAYVTDKKGNVSTVSTVSATSNGFHSNLVNQKFTFEPTEKLSFYANGGYYWKLTDRPVYTADIDGGSKYDLHYESYNFGLGGRYKINKRSSIQLDLMNDNYMQNYKYTVADDKNKIAIGDYAKTKEQHFYDAELKGIFNFAKNNMTVLGVDYRSESLDRPSARVDKSVYTASAYAQHEIKLWNCLTGIAGVRYDYHELAGGRFTPKVAVMYSVGAFNIRGTYSTGYRAPGLDELYYYMNKGKTITQGNKDLKAEHSNYYSVNLEYNTNRLNVSVTGYLNYIDDMINSTTYRLVDLPNGEELRAQAQKEFNLTDSETKALANYKLYGNLDKGVVRGFEVNAATNLGAGFSLNGNYAYAYARGKSVDGVWGNIERSVRHTGTVAGNYTHAWNDYMLNVNINGRFQSKRFHPGHSYGDAPGYGVWNLNVKHSLTGFQHLGLDFGMGLDNIFNKRDTRPNCVNYALLSPGRMAYVSLTLRFKK